MEPHGRLPTLGFSPRAPQRASPRRVPEWELSLRPEVSPPGSREDGLGSPVHVQGLGERGRAKASTVYSGFSARRKGLRREAPGTNLAHWPLERLLQGVLWASVQCQHRGGARSSALPKETAVWAGGERSSWWGPRPQGSFKLLLYLIVHQATSLVEGMGERKGRQAPGGAMRRCISLRFGLAGDSVQSGPSGLSTGVSVNLCA